MAEFPAANEKPFDTSLERSKAECLQTTMKIGHELNSQRKDRFWLSNTLKQAVFRSRMDSLFLRSNPKVDQAPVKYDATFAMEIDMLATSSDVAWCRAPRYRSIIVGDACPVE